MRKIPLLIVLHELCRLCTMQFQRMEKNSYGWFCNYTSSDHCNDSFLAFRTVEHCKEYSKKNCYIFAIKNEIVWKNLNIKVEELSFSKNIELFKKLKFTQHSI
jgi:hypothetical protein